ncbi:CREB3 protein, partial [Psophia crepitans]|nr:CREB3 protein [Psophia crepitans]
PEERGALIDEGLLDFLLKDDAPCPEILEKENCAPEDSDMSEPEFLVEEMDDIISSVLTHSQDEPGMLQGYLPPGSDDSINADQLLSYSPCANVASSPWNSEIVQADHNYSLHQYFPVMESVMSEMPEGAVSTDLGTWMGLDGTSKALELSSDFPMPVAVNAEPQLVPGAIMQVLTATHLGSSLCFSSHLPFSPGLAPVGDISEERMERQLLEKEDASLATSLPLTKAEEQLLKRGRQKIRSKPSVLASRRRQKFYNDELQHRRVTTYMTQNRELEKKVQLLQKQNMSLLKQLQKLQSSVRPSTTKTTAAQTCTMAMVLSLCVVVSPSISSLGSKEQQVKLKVLIRPIRKLPRQAASDVQEHAVLEGFTPEPEVPSLPGGLSESQEPGPSNPDPRSIFNSISSSDPPASVGSEPGPAQPREQCSQSRPLQTAVVLEWDAKKQKWVKHMATVVIQHQSADEM